MNETGWLHQVRERIRVIAASNAAIMFVGCLFLLQYWRMDAMLVFWSLLATLAVVALNMVFLLRTGNIKLSGYISVSALFALLVVGSASVGGFYDPTFSWLYVVPLAAAFLVDLTALVIFLGLVLVTTAVFWWMPPEFFPNRVPAEMYSLHSLFIRLAALVSLGTMTAFFVRAQTVALRLTKESNRALQDEAEAHSRTSGALAESEAEFRDLVENSADMIWTHDLAGAILSANESFSKFLGLPPGEVVGSGLDRFLAPDSLTSWNGYLQEIATKGSYRGLMTLRGRDGEFKVLEFHNTLRSEGVEPALVRVLARDVSVQVASQKALQSRVDQEQLMLAISTRFIDTSKEDIATAIGAALGEIGGFLDCDRLNFFVLGEGEQRFERFGSWSREGHAGEETEALGPVALPWLHPRLEQFETVVIPRLSDLGQDGRSDLAALLTEDVRSATIVPVFGREGLMGLLTLETVTAEREWLREHQALAHIAGMVFGNAIMRSRDERRTLRLRDEIQQARKMESLGLIAGGIAHDFNNLLMVVLGNASLAMSQVADGSGAQEALQAIDSSARRAARLTAQMLAYAGGASLDRKSTGLNELVRLELEQMQGGARPGIEMRTSFANDLPEVFADSALVRQLLRALLDNSFEALGEKAGVVHIETNLVKLEASSPVRGYRPIRSPVLEGRYAVLEVQDSGPGIEAGALEKIFDPFFSTKFAGRGLGLAAALGVVRGHDGIIEVESSFEGTRMRVYIPLARRAVSVPSAAALEPAVRRMATDDPTPMILIQDSNPEVLAVLDGLLVSRGFEPVGATNAQELLAELGENGCRFRAVVAELSVVEASDLLLAARWRAEDIPWILSSAERKEDISDRLAYAGASGFLSKPFEGRKLFSLLESLLRQYMAAWSAEARR